MARSVLLLLVVAVGLGTLGAVAAGNVLPDVARGSGGCEGTVHELGLWDGILAGRSTRRKR